MDMAESHVVWALVNKRAVIAGMIARAQQQLGRLWRLLPREYPPRSTVYHYFSV
jgi:transposase